MPARDFSTTAGSLDDSGYCQWSMFMTESTRSPEDSAAFLISSALCSSGVVGACTTSKPTSRASLKRSAKLRLAGSMLSTRPFFSARAVFVSGLEIGPISLRHRLRAAAAHEARCH